MPWNMQDYPDSLKNFDEVLRKKIIDIANSMIDGGYDESEAIPIATEQGKEWYENASDSEIESFKQEDNPKKNDSHDTSNASPENTDKDVKVFFEDDVWKVQTVGADNASNTYDTKEEAMDKANSIADNRGTNVIEYTKDGKKK